MSKDLDSYVPLVPRYGDKVEVFSTEDDAARARYVWSFIVTYVPEDIDPREVKEIVDLLTQEFAHCRIAHSPKDANPFAQPGYGMNVVGAGMGAHFVREYLCGHTKDQCRCPSPSKTKTILMELCPGCVKNPPKKNLHDGRYYVGIGSDPNHPAIVAGPFDGAIPVMDGHTLYVYHHKYGFVKVE